MRPPTQKPPVRAQPDTAKPDQLVSSSLHAATYDAANEKRSISGVSTTTGAGVSAAGATGAAGGGSMLPVSKSSRSHESIHAAARAASLTTRPSLRCDESRTATAMP